MTNGERLVYFRDAVLARSGGYERGCPPKHTPHAPPTHPPPGDLVFWAKLNKGACKQIAATRSEAVNASWSPCGRWGGGLTGFDLGGLTPGFDHRG
jgi:hypothetical protein